MKKKTEIKQKQLDSKCHISPHPLTERQTERERDAGGITAVLITDPWAMTY